MSGVSRETVMAEVNELLRALGKRLRPRHKVAELDLTLGQLECLHTINRLGSPSMSELSLERDLPPSSVTGTIDRLVAAGRVQREDDPDDRRVVRVRLTEQGRQERERHHQLRRERVVELLSALSDEELQQLHGSLSLIIEAAERASPE